MSVKPSVAVFKFSSDAGCQLEILNMENELLDLLGLIDLAYFPMASRNYAEGPYDIGLVEGAVTCAEEIEKIKRVREQCNLVVALGSCACFGGLPSIKNEKRQWEIEKRVYSNLSQIHSTKAFGIDEYIEVDEYLKGCPVDKEEFTELLKSILMEVTPYLRPHSVCIECKLEENPCTFIVEDKICMGPVTTAGCGAICPSNNRPCEGCRGPANDTNAPSLARTFQEYKLSNEEIRLKFRKFAGETESFRKGAEANETGQAD